MNELVTALPHPRLRRLVARYNGYREEAGAPVARPELPHGAITLIVNLGPAIRIDGEPVGSFAAGLYDRPVATEHQGEQAGVQLFLTPPAARMLLGVPLGELRDRAVGLETLLGAGARHLAERLEDARGWTERFALTDAFLARRLARTPPPHADLIGAWTRLVSSGGAAPVATLAAEAGRSRRHLSATFARELGMTPKAYGRVLRFERAVAALEAGGGESLAAVAAHGGFADQSHLNREFRALAGTTPTGFLAQRAENAFPNVQDAPAGRP